MESGLDPKYLLELKEEHGEVFEVTIGKVDYLFRALTINEFNRLSKINELDEDFDLEEAAISMAALWPKDINLDRMKPGEVFAFADQIFEQSGFTDIGVCLSYLEAGREKVQNAIEMMKVFILAAQLGYTYEQLEDFNFHQLADKVAIAEKIFELQTESVMGGGVRMNFVDPNEVTEPVKAQAFTQEDLDKINRNPDAATNLGTATVNDPIAQKLKAALG